MYSYLKILIIVSYCLFGFHCRKVLVIDVKQDCSEVIISDEVRNVLQDKVEKDSELCQKFNISLFVHYSLGEFLTVHYEPIPQNLTCCDYYQVHLVYKTDDYNGSNFETLCVATDMQSQWVLKFTNLNPGIYRVYVLPCSYNYFGYDTCDDAFNSSAVIISEEKPQTFERTIRSDSNSVAKSKLLLLSLPACLFILIVAAFLYKKWKPGNLSSTRHSAIENADVFLEEYDIASCENVEVIIFYSHDAVTKERVKLLKDFLQNCAKFKVTLLDDEIADIIINPSNWLMTKLECHCSTLGDSMNSNQKIILVEPEKALCFKKSQNVYLEDEIEEDIFQHAIHSLHQDWKRSLSDYCHLFVIQFEDISVKNQFTSEFVPGARYTIPQHLTNLCINLSSCIGPKQTSYNKRLTECLNSHKIGEINQCNIFI